MDVNMGETSVGEDHEYVRVITRLEDVHHHKSLAERLQRRYRSGENGGS